jgi:phage-related baseplate assembly protein
MGTSALPRPDFIDRDPIAIERDIVTAYQTMTGRTLQPGQIENLLIKVLAYRETLVRTQVQYAAEQNLLAYASFPMLDFLGEIVGVTRLGPQAATATIRFTLVGAEAAAVVIPVGTRVRTTDEKATFLTNDELTIQAGLLTGDVLATADTTGPANNGYIAGTISSLIDAIAFVASGVNTTESFGGADQETDDRLRDRIQQAPEGFSVAGSIGAYRFQALSVNSTIVDVSVSSPTPGNVEVVVLTSAGLPSDDLLAQVLAALSADKVRPLTDTVAVVAPTEVAYGITATIGILRGADAASVMTAAQAAADAYAADRRGALGRDIVLSQIITALSVPGVYRIDLVAPVANVDVADDHWANCTAIALTQGATYDG